MEMYASMKTEAKIRGQDCMIGLNTFCSPAHSIKASGLERMEAAMMRELRNGGGDILLAVIVLI